MLVQKSLLHVLYVKERDEGGWSTGHWCHRSLEVATLRTSVTGAPNRDELIKTGLSNYRGESWSLLPGRVSHMTNSPHKN